MNEAESLRKTLNTDGGWHALTLEGDELDGWKVVDVIEGDDRRWSRNIQVIVQSLATQDFYSFSYEHGLTEYQETELDDEMPRKMLLREEMVVKRTWVEA